MTVESELFEPAAVPSVRAAQYLRMSTDHQKYSIANQADEIRAYADINSMTIVRTFADEGRSGLTIKGRKGLQALVSTVLDGRQDFNALLVYDVSRFGRFQDIDAAAYYEYMCKMAGVRVIYCAEPFGTEETPLATLAKMLKRIMAAEYSRELSVKTFAGHCRGARLGFRQGGAPGLGLRRMMVDENRLPKGALTVGQEKNLRTDRVILVPGPGHEVRLVRRIFKMFVDDDLGETQIAAILNRERIRTQSGQAWCGVTVGHVLTREKYAGHNVYAKVSGKLRTRTVKNKKSDWVWCDDAFEPILAPGVFERAELKRENRRNRLNDDVVLAQLRALYETHGRLSYALIERQADMPRARYYTDRFGSLHEAYRRVGYHTTRDTAFQAVARRRVALRPEIVTAIVTGCEARGIPVRRSRSGMVEIGGRFLISTHVVRCKHSVQKGPYWETCGRFAARPKVLVLGRMNVENEALLDYCLITNRQFIGLQRRIPPDAAGLRGVLRTDTLDPLFEMAQAWVASEAIPALDKGEQPMKLVSPVRPFARRRKTADRKGHQHPKP